jgi:hypothetical protein
MRRLIFMIVCLLVLTAALAATAINVNFAKWDQSRWLFVKEAAFPQIGKVVQHQDYIENFVPAGCKPTDAKAYTLMLLKDFKARDFVARAKIAFVNPAAPAIILRAQRNGLITGLMYTLVIYKDGINLWRWDGKKWNKIGFTKFDITPEQFHDLQVRAQGNTFAVDVDGARVLDLTEEQALPTGEVGLWIGEGVARVERFSVRSLEAAR